MKILIYIKTKLVFNNINFMKRLENISINYMLKNIDKEKHGSLKADINKLKLFIKY